ncbi:MAG: hypothetical protein QM484_13320 [Woeseiaceae bacterium]
MHVGIRGGFTNSNSTDKNIIEESFSCSTHGDSHDRRFVLQSKVDWRDSDKYHKDSGKFRIIVTAEVEKSHSMDDRCLNGNLLIYPQGAEPKTIAERNSMNVHTLSHAIKDNNNKHENFNLLSKITSDKEPIDNFDSDYFSCSISFKIEPNGITKLSYTSNNSDLNEDSKFLITRQAFYYLKYSIHTHKHHAAKQDSLTTITPTYGKTQNNKSDAGLRLICQLKRELTFIQRIQNTDGQEHPTNNASGIIAYTKSLIQSLKLSGFIDENIANRECTRFENIGRSFQAQTCKMETLINNIELIKSKSKVWIGFIIISLWGALNFGFAPSKTNRPAIPSDDFTTGFIVILVFLFFAYRAIQIYYRNKQSPLAVERLYHTRYRYIIAKISVATITAIVLITLFLV